MRYKTLFRLGVKWLGLATFLYGALMLLGNMYFVLDSSGTHVTMWGSFLLSLEPLGGMLLGLYLFFGGKWIVNLAIPSNRPYCPECGFDLSGQPKAAVCSECGTPIPADVLSQIKEAPRRADERVPPHSEES